MKRFRLDGFLGVGIALADGLCDLGGKSLWLEASMIVEGGPCPFWMISWHFPYNRGKARRISVRVAEELETTRCAELAVFLGTASCWPAEHQSTSVTRGWLQSALGRHKCLPSCRAKGFRASANFESKLSVSAVMLSAKNEITKSSWMFKFIFICVLLYYLGSCLAQFNCTSNLSVPTVVRCSRTVHISRPHFLYTNLFNTCP
jgi:hypothetical protein